MGLAGGDCSCCQRQCIYMLDQPPPGSEGERPSGATRMGKLRKIILTPSHDHRPGSWGWRMAIERNGLFSDGWLNAKLTLWWCDRLSKRLAGGTDPGRMARGERPLTEPVLRLIREVPGDSADP